MFFLAREHDDGTPLPPPLPPPTLPPSAPPPITTARPQLLGVVVEAGRRVTALGLEAHDGGATLGREVRRCARSGGARRWRGTRQEVRGGGAALGQEVRVGAAWRCAVAIDLERLFFDKCLQEHALVWVSGLC
jgi:hypothetical protein